MTINIFDDVKRNQFQYNILTLNDIKVSSLNNL